MRMLIVDDEYGSRVLLSEILRKEGEVDVAVNGQEAMTAFEIAWKDNEPYSIVWLDIMMPEIDGHSVLKQIREYERNIGLTDMDGVTVIMTSAADDPRNIVSAYKEGGAQEYLLKPFKREQVLGVINKIKKND